VVSWFSGNISGRVSSARKGPSQIISNFINHHLSLSTKKKSYDKDRKFLFPELLEAFDGFLFWYAVNLSSSRRKFAKFSFCASFT